MTQQISQPLVQRRWFRSAVIAVLSLSCLTAFMLFRSIHNSIRSRNFQDQLLGGTGLPGVADAGFYGPEEEAGLPFRWTNGAGKLVVPINGPQPRALTVLLGLGISKPTPLRVVVNGVVLFGETVQPQGSWHRTWLLEGVPARGELVIEILSDAWIPSQASPAVADNRSLGVRVNGIVLHSGNKSYLDIPLGARFVPGVEETGFHEPEEEEGQPIRWTTGKAQLVVPVRGSRPRALAVVLDLPAWKENRLEIAVNGARVFQGSPQAENNWERTFPLESVAEGDTLTIDLVSNAIAPAQTDPKATDQRALGVKLKRVTLLGR